MKRCPPQLRVLTWVALAAVVALMFAGGICHTRETADCAPRYIAW